MPRTLADIERDYEDNEKELARITEEMETIKYYIYDAQDMIRYTNSDLYHNSNYSSDDVVINFENLQEDIFNLESILVNMLYQDIIVGPIENAIAFLKRHPGFIYYLYGHYSDNDLGSEMVGHLVDNENGPRLIYAIADIIKNKSTNVRSDLQAVFEDTNEQYEPIRRWALDTTITSNSTDTTPLEYIQAVLEVVPNGDRIFLKPRKDTIPFMLLTRYPEYTIRKESQMFFFNRDEYVKFAAKHSWPILNPHLVKLDFTFDILRRNNVPWNEIFTERVVHQMAQGFDGYLDTTHLMRWINQYPELFEMISTQISPAQLRKLENYLFEHEQEEIDEITNELLRDVNSDEFYNPLPASMMNVIGQETQKLKNSTQFN